MQGKALKNTQKGRILETDMYSNCGEATKRSRREVNRSVTSDEMMGVTAKGRR